MFCPFCGNQNRDSKKFCRQCGKAMPPPRVRVTEPQKSFSPFAPDSFSAQQTDDKSGRQPDNGRDRRPLMGGFGDFFNEAGQFLPDTLDVKPPPIPPMPQMPGAIERNSNGSAGSSAHQRPQFPDQASDISSGEFASTDELEMDKTLDKTVETPVLVPPQDRSEDKSGEATAAGFSLNNYEQADRVSRPLFNSFSSGSAQNLQHERNNRIERIALVLAIITTLAGLGILLWLLVLRPKAGA